MPKKYLVRLNQEERQRCEQVADKLKGTSQKVRRANILLKADADGPAWPDSRIAGRHWHPASAEVPKETACRLVCKLPGGRGALAP